MIDCWSDRWNDEERKEDATEEGEGGVYTLTTIASTVPQLGLDTAAVEAC